jgi:glycosyltransferase involved in cell wall biosynthesis
MTLEQQPFAPRAARPTSSRPIRVLMLSHGCQSRTEGQPKAVLLGKMPDIDLRVLTPDRWKDYGRWRVPEEPVERTFDLRRSKVRLPWLGPAQSYLHYYPGLADQVREFQPDVINVWEEPWSLVSAHAIRVRNAVLPTAKVIVETEQNIYKRLPAPFRQIRQYVLKNTDAMVGRSRESIEVLRRLGYTGPAELVPNAVDTGLFRPMDRSQCRSLIARESGIDPGERFVVGFVGRIVAEKGVTDLIEAIIRCPPDVILLMVGSGNLEAEVRRTAVQNGLGDRVILLPSRPQEGLPPTFGAMDVLAVPSRTTNRWKEQFGRVIIEAHACRLPVIGSSSGAIADVIGGGGVVFLERSVADLTEAIIAFRNDPVKRTECAGTGLAQIARSYTWDAISEQMRALYYASSGGSMAWPLTKTAPNP